LDTRNSESTIPLAVLLNIGLVGVTVVVILKDAVKVPYICLKVFVEKIPP
jgi:hypothetical protein